MKYLAFEPFKRQLEASFPNNLSKLFLVVSEDNFERLRIIDNIICYFPRNSSFSVSRYNSEKISIKEVISNLDSPSLLGGEPIIVLDEIDDYNRKDILDLVSYLKQNVLHCFLVLASKDKKSILTLLSEVDKRGVVLDLTTEKPWEKQGRLANFIIERCAQAKKSIASEAKEALLFFVGTDMCSIEKEIEKVIVYVGEKNIIEKDDILSICSNINTVTVWQIAESVIWGNNPFVLNLEKEGVMDNTFFTSLIAALRYNLQEGLKLAEALEANLNISQLFASLRPNVLKKRSEVAESCGSIFFKKMLEELFEIDMLSKSGSMSLNALIDYFRAKLFYFAVYEKTNNYTFA